ncbi:glycosyltransferase family 92 protein RCOM_0530710 [Mercurialis annua]|uniref:glycosyltransferase family 92 protein RCOM_0530710 n=1 Tax=Mercurialis annua TaxID=3986 RepID=UPI00215E6F90|nr:glycosyltransferase family 92 protein RCOM_0530710 [Mercurialis annua]
MESEQRRKRRRLLNKPTADSFYFTVRSLTVCFSFFIFLLFISSDRFSISTGSFRPVLTVPASFLPTRLGLTRDSFDTRSLPLVVEDRVLFPDHVLLIVSNKVLHSSQNLECVYYNLFSSEDLVLRPVISVDDYHGDKSVIRCPIPPTNCSASVNLRWYWEAAQGGAAAVKTAAVASWDRVVYEAVLDWNSAVVFVKGLNLRPHKESDPTQFRCHFGLSKFDKDEGFVFSTDAVAAAQEVIRCLLPRSIQNNPGKAQGIRVTVSHVDAREDGVDRPLPSVAKVYSAKSYDDKRSNKGKYELCACTMMWNQASFLREWIAYHAWLGVERWFIYDNNSDDGIQEVIDELNLENYNVSRHSWPWIKAQEAGFSHCAMQARSECKWLGFFDVDEFFYFPRHRGQDMQGQNSLKTLVANYSDSPTYAEIRTICHSFGPSGLTAAPSQGVTVGYTCRLQAPERHKSIVHLEKLDTTLLNVVHHFKLKEGYRYLNLPESTGIVNHYKYQVWDSFKAKFFRRVSTYVANWQEDQNQGSKDRAPGLGTVAVEPPDWRLRFCEVWDTGLKDFVLANFADTTTGYLPWQRSSFIKKS